MNPGRRGAVVVGVVALLAAAIAAFLVWRGRPQPRPVLPATQSASMITDVGSTRSDSLGAAPAPSPAGPPTTVPRPAEPASAAAPTSAVAAPSVIVVSVTGLVKHPGIVRLPAGARVADAIAAAGGVVGRGDITGMNLAARLTDGSSVVVGERGAGAMSPGSVIPPSGSGEPVGGSGGSGGSGGPGPTAAGPPAPIDLNTADAAALDALPGVGPVTAAAIVAYREEHGPFTSVAQLQAISGIGPARYAQIAPHVTVAGDPP